MKRDPICPPAALKRVDAAVHLGVSTTTLDALVAQRVVPPPRQVGGMKLYSRADLDAAIQAAPFAEIGEAPGEANPFDERLS